MPWRSPRCGQKIILYSGTSKCGHFWGPAKSVLIREVSYIKWDSRKCPGSTDLHLEELDFICLFPPSLPLQNTLDQQVKDLSNRLGEEVANATKAAKRDIAKLQAKVSWGLCLVC